MEPGVEKTRGGRVVEGAGVPKMGGGDGAEGGRNEGWEEGGRMWR